MNERLKALRKELHLSQEDFGKRLGVSNTAISKLEKGERSLTEQMALSICREFRVNYYWITQGKGDVFSGTPQTVVEEIAEDFKLNEIDRKIIEKYLDLTPEQRKVITDYFKSIFT